MVWKKKLPDLKFFSLILAEKPLFFPDWKKSSKFSLNSLIGGNPGEIKSESNVTQDGFLGNPI